MTACCGTSACRVPTSRPRPASRSGGYEDLQNIMRGRQPAPAVNSRGRAMIDLYYCATPNGHKMTMFLEEAELPYRIIPVGIGKGEQFKPEFLAISPNNKIPAMVDHEPPGGGAPVSLFESGAMLLYLAEKTGRLMPADLRGRLEVLKWLFWQAGGLGP